MLSSDQDRYEDNDDMNNNDVAVEPSTSNEEGSSSENSIIQQQQTENMVDPAVNTVEISNAANLSRSVEDVQDLTTIEESNETTSINMISSDHDGSLESTDIPSQQKEKECKYASKLMKLYSKKGSERESTVILDICGRRATFCAFHYPTTNTYAYDFDKCYNKEFIERIPKINMKLYRWQILEGLILKMREVSRALLFIKLI